MHPSPASLTRRRAAQHERAWRRIRQPLKWTLLAVNPLYIIGYAIGSRTSLIMAVLGGLFLIPALLLIVVELPQILPVKRLVVMLEIGIFLAGVAGGWLRKHLRDGFEIYYLSTTSGRVAAFSLFCSSTYLHSLALASSL